MRNGGDAVRICQVSEKGYFCGGIERFVFDASAALRAAGCEVYGSFRTTGNADGFAAGFDGLVPWGEFPAGFDLVILHRAADPAVLDGWNRKNRTLLYVHDHDFCCPRRHKYTLLRRRNCRKPYGRLRCFCCAPVVKGESGRWGVPPFAAFERTLAAARRCGMVAAASDFMLEELAMNGFDPLLLHKIPPPCPGADPVPPGEGEPAAVFVGQILRGKGADLFLRAFARVRQPDRAVVIGRNRDRKLLDAVMAGPDLRGRVEFVDFDPEPWKRAGNVRLAVFPSRWQEPFGLAGVEAMARGIPVVGFAVGGVTEWLEDGVNGIAVPPGDVDGLAAGIGRLLADPALAAKMGEAGRRSVERFRPELFAERILKLVRD